MAAHGVASRMFWLWPWLRRLIVVHDAFASRGVAEEQIAFFGVAQARVGVLSAEVSAVAGALPVHVMPPSMHSPTSWSQ